MIVSIFFALVIVAAVIAVGARRRTRARTFRELRQGPGCSLEEAIPARTFDEIDAIADRRRCGCGGPLHTIGEGPREAGGRRYRFVRLACPYCEEEFAIYFDVTEALQ